MVAPDRVMPPPLPVMATLFNEGFVMVPLPLIEPPFHVSEPLPLLKARLPMRFSVPVLTLTFAFVVSVPVSTISDPPLTLMVLPEVMLLDGSSFRVLPDGVFGVRPVL